ncbi:MAG: hypothetical protein QOD95_1798 [Gammaproteobacteria bacterium]|nr:hypothetical protein [Gammaproteobacteria bacterium]
MAVTVRANLKDENYFAKAASGLRELAVPERNGPPIRENGLLARLFHRLEGERSPPWECCGSGYCFLPVKVPSPNCPSDTLPLIVLPSVVLPEYFTARV